MKHLLLCYFAIIFTFQAYSQVKTFKPGQNSVVKDSSGTVLPFNTWQSMLQNGGYNIRAVNPGKQDTEFLIYKLGEQDIRARVQNAPKPGESRNFTTGKKPQLFKATGLDGEQFDLRDTTGKIVVLNFWFINCGPCRKEIPGLNELVNSFQKTGKVLFYGIALDGKKELEDFLEKVPFNYSIIDNGRYIANMYGIRSFPTHVILDAEQKVYFHTVGLATNTVYWLRKSINELLEKPRD